MIKGAKYKRNSKKQPEEAGFFDDFYLEWKTIQFIERRKVRSITQVVKQTTLTTDEYEWVCLVGGNSHQHQKYPLMIELGEEVLTCHILDYYDLVPPEGNTYVGEWQDDYSLGPENDGLPN